MCIQQVRSPQVVLTPNTCVVNISDLKIVIAIMTKNTIFSPVHTYYTRRA